MGCDVGGPDPVASGPAPKVVDVQVTGTNGLRQSVAADGSTTAKSITSVAVKFDRYMLPPTASRQGVCLQAEIKDVKSLADCTSGVGLSPTYDPVTRTVTYFLSEPLVDLQTYQLTVLNRGDNFGFVAFDGVSLDKAYTFTFKANNVGGTLEAPSADPGYCGCSPKGCTTNRKVENVFSESCPGCHQSNVVDNLTTPIEASMGMYLTDLSGATLAAGLRETVIGVTAHQTEQGGHAQVPTDNPERFGVAMPRVAAGDPGNSYLLYKILATEGLISDPTLAQGEAQRLRAGVVVGQTMPARPYTITESDLLLLSQWIAAGAQTPKCP